MATVLDEIPHVNDKRETKSWTETVKLSDEVLI